MKKVVVIGGGTGTYTVLSGLKKFDLDLTAIVTVSDSGGSTGKLRDEFGNLPVGDSRMALVALAETDEDNEVLRKLFLYRFDKGDGLRGHNFGNLFLVALTEIFGSQEKAMKYASNVLRVKGKVLPISNDAAELVAQFDGGDLIVGETRIDEPNGKHDGKKRIRKLWLQPKAKIAPEAKKAILEADLIVLGPGDLYTSVLANVVVEGVALALQKTKAKIVFNVNLIAKYGQTFGFAASDHVSEIARYAGRAPDFVLINHKPLPKRILKKYVSEKGYPVKDDLMGKTKFKLIRADLLGAEEIKKPSGDVLVRSLIRHDSDKLAREMMKLI